MGIGVLPKKPLAQVHENITAVKHLKKTLLFYKHVFPLNKTSHLCPLLFFSDAM